MPRRTMNEQRHAALRKCLWIQWVPIWGVLGRRVLSDRSLVPCQEESPLRSRVEREVRALFIIFNWLRVLSDY